MVGALTVRWVRSFIARSFLLQTRSDMNELGSIVLRPHQVSAVGRLRSAINEFGGALLCDQVGMGKTFVALALTSAECAVCVVAPAVLREMWTEAAASANRSVSFISSESLSRARGGLPAPCTAEREDRLVIVDEAHHFRNPLTKRYDALALLVAKKDVLLLSATPIHNKRRDLTTLLALFLGSEAEQLDPAQLGKIVVRRERDNQTALGLPEIRPPVSLSVSHDETIPRLLLDLPPPLPPRDAGDGGVLLVHSLIRQWASSDAALERALVRRLQRSASLTAALECGTYPSKAELSAWVAGDDSVQLAFAELVATPYAFNDAMLLAVRLHADAVSDLLKTVRRSRHHDAERAALVRSIRQNHGGKGVVAFSQYAETVEALFRLLSRDGEVAALTGNGARVAGGRITRADAIRRFAPVASGVAKPRPSEAVSLLLATDLLSEGVNLQDAAVVVHLDLPWTPARMEQRLGRVARMGSRHSQVYSYTIRPPVNAEALIRIESVLREKMKASGIVVDEFQSLASLGSSFTRTERNAPRVTEAIRSILESWSQTDADAPNDSSAVATVIGNIDGFVSLCSVNGGFVLLTRDEAGITSDPDRTLRMLPQCDGAESTGIESDYSSVVESIARHFHGLAATDDPHRPATTSASPRGDALRRLSAIASRSRPHERATVMRLAACARESLWSRIGAHGERQLATIAADHLSDTEWMRRVAELGSSGAKARLTVVVRAIVVVRSTCDSKA